ncbi:hypothetical protein F5Y17DRAFT_472195 [Xylariaceae sp. FL0594]|nr:hypothetical protein F5Y17DRAFT_472195 [Xylariaceae sp. FL0594]
MVSSASSTTFRTPTSRPSLPLPTEIQTARLCVDLYQSASGTSESCAFKGFRSALCWDTIKSTWDVKTPLPCLSSSTRDAVPLVQSPYAQGCALGKTSASDTDSSSTSSASSTWCCPSGFTLAKTACWSTLTQTASDVCELEKAVASRNDARVVSTSRDQAVPYSYAPQRSRPFEPLDAFPTPSHGSGNDGNDGDDGDDGPRNSVNSVPLPRSTVFETHYTTLSLVTVFAEATLLVRVSDTITYQVIPSSTSTPAPPASTSDAVPNKGLSHGTKVTVASIGAAAGHLLLLIGVLGWLHLRERKRRQRRPTVKPGPDTNTQEVGQEVGIGASGRDNVAGFRSTSMLLEPAHQPRLGSKVEGEPTATPRNSHDDGICTHDGRVKSAVVGKRAQQRPVSSLSSLSTKSLAQSYPAELDAVSTMIKDQVSSARASSTVLPWVPGAQGDAAQNAVRVSALVEDSETHLISKT